MPYPKQKRTTGPLLYLLTFPNGKRYVGQTVGFFEVRMTKHKSAAKNRESSGCRLLNEAIRKHGWSNMTKEILVLCNEDELDSYEDKFINVYNTLVPNGYNLITGGNSNKSMSDNTKTKMTLTRLRKNIANGKKKVMYGCCVIFCTHDAKKKLYAVIDHPLCEFAVFDEEYKMMDHLEDMNSLGKKKGIDCDEYKCFEESDKDNHSNTYFDIKYTLSLIVDKISKEHLNEDKWKRIKSAS